MMMCVYINIYIYIYIYIYNCMVDFVDVVIVCGFNYYLKLSEDFGHLSCLI